MHPVWPGASIRFQTHLNVNPEGILEFLAGPLDLSLDLDPGPVTSEVTKVTRIIPGSRL